MAAKKHTSVGAVVRHVTGEKQAQVALEEEFSKRKLAKALFALRCAHGLTQKQMAERVNCSQSKISKIEHSKDLDLSFSDLVDYTEALKLQLRIEFGEPLNAVETIKYHAFRIKECVDKLTKLAHKDADLMDGVLKFYYEAVRNIAAIFERSASGLAKPRKETPLVRVSTPNLPEQEAVTSDKK